MKLFFPILTYLAFSSGLACKSSQDAVERSTPADSTSQKPPVTTVAQNGSHVEAVIEQMQDLGDTQYNLRIFVITSSPLSGRTTIVEEGQRLMVVPQYYADSTGRVSFEDPRNKRILSIKKKQTGESFKGKVVLNRFGGWYLVDVEEPEK
jgi:hypothetical protein